MFPHGAGLLGWPSEFMLSDLAEVVRYTQRPLAQAQVKWSYLQMLLKGCRPSAMPTTLCIGSVPPWTGVGLWMAGLGVGQP